MKSAEQIKGAVKNIAKKMNLKPQEVLQIFMFERLVERLSISKYKENFILKGGLLIASMIGTNTCNGTYPSFRASGINSNVTTSG